MTYDEGDTWITLYRNADNDGSQEVYIPCKKDMHLRLSANLGYGNKFFVLSDEINAAETSGGCTEALTDTCHTCSEDRTLGCLYTASGTQCILKVIGPTASISNVQHHR